MPPEAQGQSVRDKIAFFDAWVKDNLAIDPATERARVRAQGNGGGAQVTPFDASDFKLQTDADDIETPNHAPNAPGAGLDGLALGGKYVGEQRGEGWQTGQGRATMYYDDKEREKSKVDFDETGKATSDGSKLSGERGFVVSPETGDVHQFEEGLAGLRKTDDGNFTQINRHHSTPLAGGDVAGAGKMTFNKDGRVTEINDQSGHYKPGAEFTFQAVRQINMASMADNIQAKMRKRKSETQDGGRAESADTLEQLIAEEVNTARQAYFAALDKEQEELEAKAAALPAEHQDAAFEAIASSRHEKANEFRDIAADLEKRLRDNAGQGSLLASASQELSHWNDNLPPKVRKLLKAKKDLSHLLEDLPDDPDDEEDQEKVADLKAKIGKIDLMIKSKASTLFVNKEAKVKLLGKAGMLSDAEYTPDKDGYNDASAIKQLQAPLGEEAYAQLLTTAKSGEASPIEEAMRARGLEPGQKGAVAALKKQLGIEAAERTQQEWQAADEAIAKLESEQEELRAQRKAAKAAGDDDLKKKLGKQIDAIDEQIDDLNAPKRQARKKYEIVEITENYASGSEVAGFEVGKASAVTLTAQQFLQTGGNEAQIRTKKRLVKELGGEKPDPRTEADAFESDVQALNDRYAKLGKQREAIDAAVAAAKPEGADPQADKELERMRAEAADAARDLLADLTEMLSEVSAAIKTAKTELEELDPDDDEDEYEETEDNIDALEKLKKALKPQQKALRAEFDEKDNIAIDDLLKDVYAMPELKVTKLRNDKKELKEKIDDLDASINMTRSSIAYAKSKNDTDAMATYQAEIDDLDQQKAALQQELKKLKAQIAELEGDNDD